jgi:hypothetical protein
MKKKWLSRFGAMPFVALHEGISNDSPQKSRLVICERLFISWSRHRDITVKAAMHSIHKLSTTADPSLQQLSMQFVSSYSAAISPMLFQTFI